MQDYEKELVKNSLEYIHEALKEGVTKDVLTNIDDEITELYFTLFKKTIQPSKWSKFKEIATSLGGDVYDDCVSFGMVEFYRDGRVYYGEENICPQRSHLQMINMVKDMFGEEK